MIDTSPTALRKLAEPQTYLHAYGDRVIVCETDTGRVVCGFDMHELLAIAAEKEAQNHPEQLLELVAPADVPLPEPLFLLHCGEVYDDGINEWETEANSGRAVDDLANRHPGKTLSLYPEEQLHQYAEAYAKAAVAAVYEKCIGAVSGLYEELKLKAGRIPDSFASARLEAIDIAEQRLEALRANQKGTT